MKPVTLKGIALVSLLASATLLSGCGASHAVKMHIAEVEKTAHEAMMAANAADHKAEKIMMMMRERGMMKEDMMHKGMMMKDKKGMMMKDKKGMMMKYKK